MRPRSCWLLVVLPLLLAACDGSRRGNRKRDAAARTPQPKAEEPRLTAPPWPKPGRQRPAVVRIAGESTWDWDPDEPFQPLEERHIWVPAGRYLPLTLGTDVPYPLGDETEVHVERGPLGWRVNGLLYALDLRSIGYELPLPGLERDAASRAPCLTWAGPLDELPMVSAAIRRLPHQCVALAVSDVPREFDAPAPDAKKKTRWKNALLAIADRIVSLHWSSDDLSPPFAHLTRLRLLHTARCRVPGAGEAPLLEVLGFRSTAGDCSLTTAVLRLSQRKPFWSLTGLGLNRKEAGARLPGLGVERLSLNSAMYTRHEDERPRSRPKAPPVLPLPTGLRELRFSRNYLGDQTTIWTAIASLGQLRVLAPLSCPSKDVSLRLQGLEVLLEPQPCDVPTPLPALRAATVAGPEGTLAARLALLVRGAPQLLEISITSNGALSGRDLVALTALVGTLRHITITCSRLKPGVGEILGQLTKLQTLRLEVEDLTDEFAPPWTALSVLHRLDLLKARIPPEGLRGVGALTALTELSIGPGGQGPVDLSELGRLRRLRRLSLRGVSLTDAQASALGALRELRWLDLADTPIGERELSWLGRLTRLRHLDLSGTLVDGPRVQLPLRQLTKLVSLHLEGAAVTELPPSTFSRLRQLRTLTIGHNALRAGFLADAWLPPHLNTLRVPYTHLNGDDLASLRRLPRLRELDARGTGIDDRSIARLPPLPELRRLVLGQNKISGPSLVGLQKRYPAAAVSCLPCWGFDWIFEHVETRRAAAPRTSPK